MKSNCRTIRRRLYRWFELDDREQQIVKEHAEDCPSCRETLDSIERVLNVLDTSASPYRAMQYTGPMPAIPDKSGLFSRLFRPLPALATAAAAVLVIVIAWSGGNVPPTSDPGKGRSAGPHFHMPSMPSAPSMGSISLSPGSVSGRVLHLQSKYGSSVRRRMKIPDRPDKPNDSDRQRSCTDAIYRA